MLQQWEIASRSPSAHNLFYCFRLPFNSPKTNRNLSNSERSQCICFSTEEWKCEPIGINRMEWRKRENGLNRLMRDNDMHAALSTAVELECSFFYFKYAPEALLLRQIVSMAFAVETIAITDTAMWRVWLSLCTLATHIQKLKLEHKHIYTGTLRHELCSVLPLWRKICILFIIPYNNNCIIRITYLRWHSSSTSF